MIFESSNVTSTCYRNRHILENFTYQKRRVGSVNDEDDEIDSRRNSNDN